MKMSSKPVVLVLMGGPDAERAVSLDSGDAVAAAPRAGDSFDVREAVIDRPDAAELTALAADHRAEVIFPVLHGPWGEGGPLQSILEDASLPFVGSRARPAALAMDKDALIISLDF